MTTLNFTANATKTAINLPRGLPDFLVSWSGTAANGLLRIYTENEGITTPVPDSQVTIGELDGDGNVLSQMIVRSNGAVSVELSAATGTINLNVVVT